MVVNSKPIRTPMIERLFPRAVVAFEVRGTGSPTWLKDEELEFVKGSADRRIAEFAAGRACARYGLEGLGHPTDALLSGADRAPIWPKQAVGSITHTTGYCVSVVGERREALSLGIDAETVTNLTSALYDLLFTEREVDILQGLDEERRQEVATIIFAAKEAFYKCQYPLTKTWLDFHDVTVTTSYGSGEVTITSESVLVAGSSVLKQRVIRGKYLRDGGIIVCGVALLAKT